MSGPDHDHGSFKTNKPTRDYYGDGVLTFIEKQMLIRKDVPLNSFADCASPDVKRSLTFVFGLAATPQLQDELCKALETDTKVGPGHVRLGAEDDKEAVGAISVPTDARATFEIISGMKQGLKHGVSTRDADVFFLMHEVNHENVFAKEQMHSDAQNSSGLEEYKCDMVAREWFGKALKEGIVTDARVPDAVRGTRALSAMSSSNKYDANALAGIPGIAINTKQDHAEAMSEINSVREKVYSEIGRDLVTEDQKTYARYSALQDTLLNAPDGAVDQKILDRFAYKTMTDEEYRKHMQETVASVSVPESLREQYAQNEKTALGNEQKWAGQSAAISQPELAYQAARRMDAKGDFDGNKYGKAFAREFVRAAEEYAPEFFKTDGQKTYPQEKTVEASAYVPRPVAANNTQFQMTG